MAAGIPAPRADYAMVELNGRKLGVFVLLEGYNRLFLKRHFKNTKGNLYDGGFLKDIDSHLATNSGENPNDQSDLQALVDAAGEPDTTNRFSQLDKVLDMDRFISFIATEVMICHWDGYALNRNNFRVYHDMDKDRIMFMPHGMDQMFGVVMTDANMAIRPPMQGLVAKALMETAEGRRRFYERLNLLNQTVFNLDSLTNRIEQLVTRLRPVLAETGASAVENYDGAVSAFQERVIQRKQNLDEQLTDTLGKALAFDTTGAALLTGWSAMTNYGRPVFAQPLDRQGKALLQISAQPGGSIGSWRTKVLLEDGHYVFEARVQTEAVDADPADRRGGAGLRISGRPAFKKILGNSDWTRIAYEFEVPDGLHDVELVCELRAAQGQARFDAQSLKLVRK
jgi:hypothetical protein